MSIDWLPSRKITPKEIGNRGFLPTSKNPHEIVEYESCLERNMLLSAIHCPSVKKIQHQPKTITYQDKKGKKRNYTPDIYIETDDGSSFLIEVKPHEEVINNGTKYEERWKAARNWSDLNNAKFLVLTEHEINTPRWMNIWFTLGASKCIDNDRYVKSLNLLISADGERYNFLCQKLASNVGVEIGKAAQIICYAIYHGLVFVDSFSSRQISKETIIRRKMNSIAPPFKPLLDEIKNSLEMREIPIVSDTVEKSESQLKSISPDLRSDDKYEGLVETREKMVLAWLKQPTSKRTPEWCENFYDEWKISRSQLYRIIKRYKQGGRGNLYPNHEKSGRKRRYSDTLLDSLEKARNLYLNPNTTLHKAYHELEILCKSAGIATPKKSSFYWYIYQSTTAVEFALKKGKKYLKSHFTPSFKSFQGGVLPMQVIQMDNTSLDVFPVDNDERELLSPPYMTAAIDCYTGMISGFSVSYFTSSSRTILDVLVQSILRKDSYTRSFETQQEWPIQGFPVVILVDNGMDYRSKDIKDFCTKHDIILEFVPLRTPRYKAYIEQWFNILRNAMLQESIPGYRLPFKRHLDNPELKPEKDAVLTLQEIEMWLHKWIIDEYHLSNQHDDHVLAPYLKLSDARDGQTDTILPAPREPPNSVHATNSLYLDTLHKEARLLTRNGIQWEHLRYNSPELAEIFKIRGNEEVTILRDTRDVRRTWIINPINERPLLIGLGSGWAAALLTTYGDWPVHESAWIRDVRRLQMKIKGKITPYIFLKQVSQEKRESIIDNAKKQQKVKRKEREKIKEINIKSIEKKLTTENLERVIIQAGKQDVIIDDVEAGDDIFKTYKPKGLNTSRYPKKA